MAADLRFQYGGNVFARASAFASRRSDASAGIGSRVSGWSARERSPVAGAIALVHLLVRLPRLEVNVSDDAAGREIDRFLRARAHGVFYHRIAQGVLEIPPQYVAYLRGRSRQAVRTNLHRAESSKLRCHPLVAVDALDQAAERLGMPKGTGTLMRERDDAVWVARDEKDQEVGLLWATIDSEWAMLRNLAATRGEARYLLHTELVRYLGRRGVRYLFVQGGNALSLAPGLQYFQRLLGYQVVCLRGPHGPRRLESMFSRRATRREPSMRARPWPARDR